ncbi:hypothetical protein HMPREF0454_02425 [Hafnia alvei ATCC 51873]|uniref:Uncharacterized protein n=1 Tax=Hafnia alvei ATCC 51873 TaxID=1002364 RepID=G9Y753_HAFAL|nr:hypothetical protein HMPREF0454_02425 [Hafnia alvei ATCC 51873]
MRRRICHNFYHHAFTLLAGNQQTNGLSHSPLTMLTLGGLHHACVKFRLVSAD